MATPETRARCESDPDVSLLPTNSTLEQPLYRSLFQNPDVLFFAKKLPPSVLSFNPRPVRGIWGFYNYKKDGMLGSTVVDCLVVAVIIGGSMLTAQNPDWSQACGQHFSKQVQHISQILVLTTNQQAEIKPILEQEAEDLTEICLNPELSRVDKVNQYKRLVRASDEKIKPLLLLSQLKELGNLRREQKQGLEEIIAKQMSTQPKD